MERDFEKDIIELDAAIKSNAERDNTFTLSVLQRAKEIILQQKEKLKAYEDTGLTPEEILNGKMFTGWISVAERLPESETMVLAYIKRNDVEDDWRTYQVCKYTDHWIGTGNLFEVVTWMPLPESYNPQN